MKLDLQHTVSTTARQSAAQVSNPSAEQMQETNTQKLSQLNSELLALCSCLDQATASATLDMLIRGTGESQYVVDETTTTLIEDILHNTTKFLDVLGSIAGSTQLRSMTNISPVTDPSLASNSEPKAKALYAGSSVSCQDSVAFPADGSQLSPISLPRSTLDVDVSLMSILMSARKLQHNSLFSLAIYTSYNSL
jgi:hypothetical protein